MNPVFETVKAAVDKADFMKLLCIGAPPDEYDMESAMIAAQMSKQSTADEIAGLITETFAKMFGTAPMPAETVSGAANEIAANCIFPTDADIAVCDECGSRFLKSSSRMTALCPECASILYGYKNCKHRFVNGNCVKCLWDGSRSAFILRSITE